MKFLVFALLTFLCYPALAQDVLDEVANKIVLEEQAKTVEEVQKRLATRHEAANRHAIADLERIARTAVSNGEIADAAEAWEEILSIDLTHEGAANFFKTIGREEYKPKRNDNRNLWTSLADPNTGFMRTRTGWVEVKGETKIPWTEVGRTEHLILLENAKGGKGHLHRDAWYWKGKGGTTWHHGYFGKWIR